MYFPPRKPRGLPVDILRADLSDYSNGGLSATCDKATLIGPGVPELFEPTDKAPAVELLPPNLPGWPPKVVPVDRNPGAWPMMGGTFVWTCDSRFPARHPLALHDRFETRD